MKTYIFIDGRNFFRSIKRHDSNIVVDYDKLAAWLTYAASPAATCEAVYYYVGIHHDDTAAESFVKNLQLRKHYFIRQSPLVPRSTVCYKCGTKRVTFTEKGIDTRLTADVVHFAGKQLFDTGIIVSGDVDYIPAIETATQLGRDMWVASIDPIAEELTQSAFGAIHLAPNIDQFSRMRAT
jgi:uncharacterized LabA/DUF88 family protein